MPSAVSSRRRRALSAASRMITLSVSSSSTELGARPLAAITWAMVSVSVRSWNWRPERLTARSSGSKHHAVPALHLGAGGAQHPPADREDEAGLLGERDELAGRDGAEVRVAPAQQGL